MTRQRHVPVRTCTACGASSEKRTLVRFVRTPDGHVEVDLGGRANGRGAYLCAEPDCFEMARKRRKLDAALRVTLQDDDYDRLNRDFSEAVSKPASTQGE